MKDIGSRRPLNAVADRVTRPGPKGYESDKRILQVCSPTPLPLRPVPTARTLPNLTGTVRGHLRVIGLWEDNSAAHARWVCKCVCGYYTTRSTKALRNERNDDRCDRCRQVDYLRRSAFYRENGFDLVGD